MHNATDIFGKKVSGKIYSKRPGAYGILQKSEGLICILEAPSSVTFPGGGIDSGESHEDTLHREILEETGYEIYDVELFGYGETYSYCTEQDFFFVKQCHYFLCKTDGTSVQPSEDDHKVLWLSISQAIEKLSYREHSNNWILGKFAENSDQ